MTAAQKKNVERFKKAAAEAKKLRAKNPKLSQAEAVKKAFATLYGTAKKAAPKKTVKKKAAPKKVAKKKIGAHKDTRSHNVNIRVVSGVKRKIGALPVGFTGKFLGWPFKVQNQMTLDGGVTAQIVELNPPGSIVAELNGRIADAERSANAIRSIVIKQKYPGSDRNYYNSLKEKEKKSVDRSILNFTKQLNSEVNKYNSGADKRTKQAKPAVIKYTATVKKMALVDQIKKILADNNKRLKRGYATVPGKPRIKGDIVGAIKTDAADSLKKMISHLSAVQAEKQANKKSSAKMTAAQKKQQAAHLRNLAKTESAVKKRITELKRAI
jgi:hypothetical protein